MALRRLSCYLEGSRLRASGVKGRAEGAGQGRAEGRENVADVARERVGGPG